jgi:hypothetical protein
VVESPSSAPTLLAFFSIAFSLSLSSICSISAAAMPPVSLLAHEKVMLKRHDFLKHK